MWARLTWCSRRSRRIVCRAVIFTDFSTYSEQVALKSSLAALERDGRTWRWSIAVISCETSADLHSNHTWITFRGKGRSSPTHSQEKSTFSYPPLPWRRREIGWDGLNHLCSIRSPAPKILAKVSARVNKPKQSPGLSCEGRETKSYRIFPSTWHVAHSLTRCCCVHVVQPTAPVHCALSSAQLQRAKTRVLRVWRGRRASVWRGRADVNLESYSLCLLDSDVIVFRICSTKRPRFNPLNVLELQPGWFNLLAFCFRIS